MLKKVVILIPFLLFISCLNTPEVDTNDTKKLSVTDNGSKRTDPSRKPVIAILPVLQDKQDPTAEALGEAYLQTLTALIESMQFYDLRYVPEEYLQYDLTDRGFDNIIRTEVGLSPEGTLILNSRVIDGWNQKEALNLSEEITDYLALFKTSEEMALRMVEGFYGEHIAMSRLKITSLLDFEVFVDGVYRTLDQNQGLDLLSGLHEILIMGDRPDTFITKETMNFEEGREYNFPTLPSFINSVYYLGTPQDIRIDGSISEWEDIEIYAQEEIPLTLEDPGMDIEWFKIIIDRENFYGLVKFKGPFSTGNLTLNFGSNIQVNHLEDGSLQTGAWANVKKEYFPDIGNAVRKDNYLEMRFPLDKLDVQIGNPQFLVATTRPLGAGYNDHIDRCANTNKFFMTDDFSPWLTWANQDWQNGTATAQSTYTVPNNLIDIDGSDSDWELVPVSSGKNQNLPSGDLMSVKSASDGESFYLLLESFEKWDKKREVIIELDGGDEVDRSLIIQKRQVLLQKGESTVELSSDLKLGQSLLEAKIPLEEIGPNLNYINLKKIHQQEGSEFLIIPYY